MFAKAIEHHHEASMARDIRMVCAASKSRSGRAFWVADAFVNMTTERAFAAAKTTEQALTEIEKMSGTRYDGMLVRSSATIKSGKMPSLGD